MNAARWQLSRPRLQHDLRYAKSWPVACLPPLCGLQCGPSNDDAWNRAEEETELAKKEACNVKVQTSKATETAEIAAQKKREV